MTDDVFDSEAYIAELRAKRTEKDEFFDTHPQSPIPPEERDTFDGLDYFDPDPDYRVTASVETHDDPEPVVMDTSTGREVRYLRVATFHFELRGTDLELGAYRQEHDNSPTLFVPFRDKTTGQQTYNGGRYMELTPDAPLDELDEVVVDFNLAYNPFCAFTDTFDCPLPPEENWLDVVVPAGEQTYDSA
ncbi:DUF1684 domain-containing protein [Haloferax mediterranei ATCC 33500]|uniref:DUF1684 domain-containing protein n=1 Tax=Haloferax mediterranei (strain ATCC 33500 / DSM 1411 / JCM 8866 / NBRC 14739 / NCIMB 2177 / R-4) TaxID=523841 RepID=I3R7C9_HALMT|nr:DUF1684 domain-containing protein [Haloferax mediterranei]AFK20139.1 hypothetical protein HFX_2454 [Haloferax mediterranei ATCC 33500]AHZ23513.1 hypothetical protein BM92_13065 [Haloferax mediterranei ATCC 33500]ELZ99687.1 hypothetical protein C439_14074 [Haloferax mediterranei ATCC 33500]MDX5987109.1 DUF1684 domain-containing protein [Haloferax mediterranei ATCC 33500]QCQ76423.1 DUF1684 domain-containing protein [Haloferax mediterranei ATCC 33500]